MSQSPSSHRACAVCGKPFPAQQLAPVAPVRETLVEIIRGDRVQRVQLQRR
jgi:predicted nucleic acid-binding Zn ribbon protein